MNVKTLLMLLAVTASIGLLGCRRESPTTKQGRAPSQGQGAGTAKEGTSGTAKTPGATPEAPSEVGKATGQTPGAVGQAVAQQKQEFIASAEKTLNNLDQQAQTLQKAQVPEQDQAKVQQLSQQLQQQIANARQTLSKLRDASPTAWQDMRVAVSDAIQNAQGTFKELQTVAQGQGQRQVTQQQP